MTTPLPAQEPAGAVEASKLAGRLKAICDSHINSATAHEAAYRLIESLASLPPVTQAKSEAVVLRYCLNCDCPMPQGCGGAFDGDPPCARTNAKAATSAEPPMSPDGEGYLYAAPQEAVERQPLTGWHTLQCKPLTDDDIEAIASSIRPITETGEPSWEHAIARAIERAHGIGPATQEKQHG